MGYIDENAYQCDYCGFEGEWGRTYDINGDLWSCENCGKVFCSQCLRAALGEKGYWKIMREHDLILCPDCARKTEV